MLLASAPLRQWSLLSSRPTSRAHNRSLRQGNPTGREAGLDMHLQEMHVQVSTPFSRAIHTIYYVVCVRAMWIDRTPTN